MELVVLLIFYLFFMIMIMITVAFVTLMEQKVLGGLQIRLGPTKVGFWGLLQPFGDAVKLFFKEVVISRMSNSVMFFVLPMVSLFLVLILWLVFPLVNGGLDFELGVFYFICVSSLAVFPIMSAGWVSNSKYSLLGGLRAVAQMISYEVSLSLVLLSVVWVSCTFNFFVLMSMHKFCYGLFIYLPLGFIWFASSLAETNRTPYDFAEGESELVSGFNTEYSAGGFTLIFLAEYASIIFMSVFFVILFVSENSGMFFIFKSLFLVFCFIWVRGTMPRFRYDKLMHLAWKSFLPISLFALIYYCSIF